MAINQKALDIIRSWRMVEPTGNPETDRLILAGYLREGLFQNVLDYAEMTGTPLPLDDFLVMGDWKFRPYPREANDAADYYLVLAKHGYDRAALLTRAQRVTEGGAPQKGQELYALLGEQPPPKSLCWGALRTWEEGDRQSATEVLQLMKYTPELVKMVVEFTERRRLCLQRDEETLELYRLIGDRKRLIALGHELIEKRPDLARRAYQAATDVAPDTEQAQTYQI